MSLDKSSCALLRYLIRLKKPETIMAISRALQQSRRKIYYHLDKINSSLPKEVESIESQPRVGILLSPEQKAACQVLLDSLDSYSYIMNMNERIQLMMIYICITTERVTIEKLMELTEVSRNTVLNDLSEIRSQLAKEQYKMTLYVSKSQGYDLNCHPLNKIQYMHSLLYNLFAEANEGFLKVLETKVHAFPGCQQLLSMAVTHFLEGQVYRLEKDLGKKINRYEIEFMLKVLPYLLLSYRNMVLDQEEKDSIIKDFSLIRKRIEYKITQNLKQALEDSFAIGLDEIEVSLIAILLLSYRKDKDIHVTSQDFADLKRVVEQFIWHFEVHSSFELENKEELAQSLLAHCKALLFRKTYGILSKNPMVKQIQDKYSTLFRMTKLSARLLEEEWKISLTDEDIAYLTIHLGGALRRSGSRTENSRKVYLICDEGVAVQKLLVKQVQHHLPGKLVSGIFTTEQFKSVEDLLEVDFLISTSEALETKHPLIQVHPILDFDDVLKLTRFAKYRFLADDKRGFSAELDKLLAAYIPDGKTAQELKQRLQSLVTNELLASLSDAEVETDLY
ncbi:BglG family transcription antiterminator [Streptococcus oriscaviae]|uniref:Transcription antiterminator n=1 Tax=Streptococcus oriscaviae TaxID=2781599 RepID=A0ABX7YJA7_9STRE|nr:transcription antiterminator [Streptococcus oriscaviae]QUE53727.1 transcription antiterminator [Streptococcus oriscaviae]